MGVEAPAMMPFQGSGDAMFNSQFSPTEALRRRDEFSSDKLYVLKNISLGVGSLSIVSTLFAFYWFIRMRRNFRQE
jgi:G protein-coupled receptor GPR1